MASPPEVTLGDLSGQWVMNKNLSDDPDAVLTLQGVSWVMRKAIAWATITLSVKQYNEGSISHIDIEQTATGGIKGTSERRVVDWTERAHNDHMFGDVKAKSRWVEDLSKGESGKGGPLDTFLTEGWLPADKYMQSWVVNEGLGWSAEQIWGFVTIDGARYYVRKVVAIKGKEVLKIRLVYDWQGKAE